MSEECHGSADDEDSSLRGTPKACRANAVDQLRPDREPGGLRRAAGVRPTPADRARAQVWRRRERATAGTWRGRTQTAVAARRAIRAAGPGARRRDRHSDPARVAVPRNDRRVRGVTEPRPLE